jgi:hypothetical protein
MLHFSVVTVVSALFGDFVSTSYRCVDDFWVVVAFEGGGGRSGTSKASSPEPGEGDAPDAPSGPDTGADEGRDMERVSKRGQVVS